jgi:hypothetical protein
MTWLYRPDAIQCLTNIRVSALRHNYGKMAAAVRTICDPVRTVLSIRQLVHTKFNRLDVRLHGPDTQALLWKLRVAEMQPSGHLRYFDHNFLLKYRIGTKLASLKS